MRWPLLALLPAVALAGGFGNSISSSPPASIVSGGGGTAPRPPTLVGTGDSIMQLSQLPQRIATTLGANWYAVNAGVSGETAAQISARWFSSEATYCGGARCAYAYVEGGVNSIKGGGALPAATVLTTMLGIVDDALSKGYVVVWSDILPFRGWPFEGVPVTDLNIDLALAYNAGMQAACTARATNTRLRCVFAYNAFVDPTRLRLDGVTPAGYLLPAYSADELHLNEAGSAALAALAAARLP